jgi:hypothetical protein
VRKLYLCGMYFGCRHCHDLTYTSRQESDSRVYAMLRAGLHPGMLGGTDGMSVTQLGLVLKALTLEERRIGRPDKRLSRGRGRRQAERDANNC